MPSDAAIISAFVADAPPGELSNVVADIESLTGKSANLDDAFEKYNEEQFVTVQLPGSSGKEVAIVSEWSRLGGGRYFDPSSATSFAFDHKTQKASAVQSQAVEGEAVQSILKALGIYAKEHYERPAYGVYALDGGRVGVLIASNKYSPQNFWNGRWRARYIYDPSASTVTGSIRVDVHYYEDGNVRLLTDKPQTASVSGSGVNVVREIAALEKTYQEELNKKFLALSEGAFKGLRRQLPVTRQKIEWEKVASYRLGQDIGGGGRK